MELLICFGVIVLFALLYLQFLAPFSFIMIKRKLYEICGLGKKASEIFDYLIRINYSCDIPASVKYGTNCTFAHKGLGIVIHGKTEIGNDCKIFQHVTIGSRNGSAPPVIGNNVYIGVGASVLGNVKIGNNVKIGAHALVLTDIPDNCTAIGVPAKIIKKD